MDLQDKALINQMEVAYETVRGNLEGLVSGVEVFKESYEQYRQLKEFYGSKAWFSLSEQDLDNVKAGVLSQDQLFDLITDHNNLLEELLELSVKMYQNR